MIYMNFIIERELSDLQGAILQISRQMTRMVESRAHESPSLSPVLDESRRLPKMSRSFKKTLHVNYISIKNLSFIYSCN